MKTINFLGLVSAALIALAFPASAGPRGGGVGFGGSGHVGGVGRPGGFAGGGPRAAPAFHSGDFRTAPSFRGSYFTGKTVGRPAVAPRFYYGSPPMSVARSQGLTRPLDRSSSPYVTRSVVTRQPNRVGSIA